MRTRFRVLRLTAVSVLAVSTMLALASAPANAAANSTTKLDRAMALARTVAASPDPSASLSKLSTADRDLVKELVTPVRVVASTDKQANAVVPNSQCGTCNWSAHNTWAATDVLGITLFRYWQTTTVYIVLNAVSRVTVTDAGGEVTGYGIGWSIKHAPTTATKNCGWEGRGLAKYYFVWGAGGWDISHPTACGQIRLNANHTNSWMLTQCDIQYNNVC